ncbi:MAG: hypothetical protein ABL903_08610 [Methylococcales bacterium]
MSVCRKKGWFIASIGGLAVADRDRLAAMSSVVAMFSARAK